MADESSTDLTIFEQRFTPAALFAPGAREPLLAHIKSTVLAEVFDSTTPEGRKRIISRAMDVTKTKTAIDAARKALVADAKARTSKIDAEGRLWWDELEAFAKAVRQPVTDFEQREKDRIQAHEVALDAIKNLDDFGNRPPATAEVAAKLAAARAVDTTGFEEFTTIAAGAKTEVIERLEALYANGIRADEDRAELERLRVEKIERERADREADIARWAAEQERRTADEALAAAKRREDEAEARAAQAEQQRHDAIAKAERDRLAAESEATRREAESAERERQKIAAEQREAAEETARREADTKHKAPINRAIVAALVSLGLTETMAKAVVTALARGAIPHTKIGY